MINVEKAIRRNKLELTKFEKIRQNFNDNPRISIIKKGENPKINPNNNSQKCFYDFQDSLDEILRACYKESKVKEPFSFFDEEYEKIIPKVGVLGLESGMQITAGLFRDFYIISELICVEYLNYMKDDFWHLLTRLQDYGKFRFIEEPSMSSNIKAKYPKLFNKRGHIYKISRNYFIYQTEYGYCRSLGFLEVKWDRNMDFKQVINNYLNTFDILYKINELLYQSHLKYGG